MERSIINTHEFSALNDRNLEHLLNTAKEEGQTEGKAELIFQLLLSKYGAIPEWAMDMLVLADADQLEVWANNILYTDNIQHVFIDHQIDKHDLFFKKQ